MNVPLALSQNVVNLMYVVAAIGFILGIKRLSLADDGPLGEHRSLRRGC